ncbi:MAG TPA: GWxTD domain-containing protein [Bryobacteraceae bacterium]|nr:GWxTD domain-containing protein [Bryobacteraceae bacterium]
MRLLAFAFVATLACPLPAATVKLPAKYTQWLDKEVVYIITDDERKVFLRLADDAARDHFIDEFWTIRNPLGPAKENPYKEEHDRRIAYANENFGRHSNTPGWMTDMGRTYILFGKPETKFNMTGYGQIYPLELWFYENKTGNPSLPPFFYVLFFIPEDIGEYRFYHPIVDGPQQLVRGSQFRSNSDVYKFLKPYGGDIAHAAFSLIPNEPIDTQFYNPNMSGEMLVAKIQNLANDTFNVRRLREMRSLRGEVQSYFLVSQDRPLDIEAFVVADAEGQYWLDYSVWINDEKLGRAEAGSDNLIVSAAFRLETDTGQLIVEDSEERGYPAFSIEAGEKKFTGFQIANRVPFVPGAYRLEVEVSNRKTGKVYRGERKIGAPAAQGVSLGVPLAASSVAKAKSGPALTPFQYFGVQFLPAAGRRFKVSVPLRLLTEIGAGAGSVRDYRIEYVLANVQNREARRTIADTAAAAEFRNGRLLKAKTLPLEGLPPGDYRLVMNLRTTDGAPVVATANLSFKIDENAVDQALYFLDHFHASAQSGVAAYVRALEAVAQKDSEKAAAYLVQALNANPSNTFATELLVSQYFRTGKFDRVVELAEKLGMQPFQAAPETLAQLSVSFWQAGRAADARRVLEAGSKLFPKDPLLAAAARNIARAPAQ